MKRPRPRPSVVPALCCGVLCATAGAQISVPARSGPDLIELNSRTNYPFMRAQSRSQFVIAASEIGPATTLTQLKLRWDGPTSASAGGTVQSLDIWLGNGVAPAASTPYFASNYTSAPTRVLAATNFQFNPDASTNGPEEWGGPNGELTFVFTTPFVYGGGDLVLDLRVAGNSNAGTNPANDLLDFEEDPGVGPTGGTATVNGTGCNGATLAVSGQLAPGGVLSCHGTSLGAFAPVLDVLGSSRSSFNGIPLPLPLDAMGAPGCSLYNNWVSIQVAVADGAGVIAPYRAETAWPVPASTTLNGVTLQFQLLSVVPSANALGVLTTNNVEVRLGNWVAPTRAYMAWFHHGDRDATLASFGLPAVLAVQFN